MIQRITDNVTSWTRTCPSCDIEVSHTSEAKCRFSEKKNKLCAKCSNSLNGSRNAKTSTCPVCDETIRIPVTKQLDNDHVKKHGITLERAYQIKHCLKDAPLCRCGCEQKVSWSGWWNGYNAFIIGHNAKIWSSYDEKTAKELSLTRGKNWRGKKNQFKGETKETNFTLALAAEKRAITVKEQFASGERHAWNNGL